MGARTSILKHKLSSNRPSVLMGSIFVAGHSWITEPLIKTFCGYGENYRPFSGRCIFTIDGTTVDVTMDNRPMPDLSQLLDSYICDVGLMLTYDVADEDSFEAAKQTIISPHPKMNTSDVPMVLVGCHCQKKRREVSYYGTREFADERGIPVVEVWEEEAVNTELAFMTLIGEMLSKNTFRRLEVNAHLCGDIMV